MQVAISDIVVTGDNFRKNFSGVKELAENMRDHGQLQPIVIDEKNNLVAGECRLRAATELGWKTIEVKVRPCKDKKERIMLSLYENLKRRTFDSADELRALAWLRNNLQAKGEANKQGGDKKSKCQIGTLIGAESFAEKIAKETGMKKRTVYRKARIGERMSDEVGEALDKKEVTQEQVEQIVKVPKEQQTTVLRKAKGKTVQETKAIVKEAIKPETKEEEEARVIAENKSLYNAVYNSFERLHNNLCHVLIRQVRFADITSILKLRMMEAKFSEKFKQYKELQYVTKRLEVERDTEPDASGLGRSDPRSQAKTALADDRTIDVPAREVSR